MMRVGRGTDCVYSVQLGIMNLWSPVALKPDEYECEIVRQDGKTGIVLATSNGVRRIDEATGKVVWDSDASSPPSFGAPAKPAAAPAVDDQSPGPYRVMEPAADFDGDGCRDVVLFPSFDLLYRRHKPGTTSSGVLRAFSWVDGHLLWSSQSDLGVVVGQPAVADADGDGVPDLIATCVKATQEDSGQCTSIAARFVVAISGRTGQEIWRYAIEPQWFKLSEKPLIIDPDVRRFAWSFDQSRLDQGRLAEIMAPYPAVVHSADKSAAALIVAGTQLLELDVCSGKPLREALELGFYPQRPPRVADLDGDGLPEVLLVGAPNREQGGWAKLKLLRAISLRSQAILWEVSESDSCYCWADSVLTANLPILARLADPGRRG